MRFAARFLTERLLPRDVSKPAILVVSRHVCRVLCVGAPVDERELSRRIAEGWGHEGDVADLRQTDPMIFRRPDGVDLMEHNERVRARERASTNVVPREGCELPPARQPALERGCVAFERDRGE